MFANLVVGKMKRNNTGSTDSEADCLIPRMRPGSRGEKGSRVRALSAEIEDLVHHSSLGKFRPTVFCIISVLFGYIMLPTKKMKNWGACVRQYLFIWN